MAHLKSLIGRSDFFWHGNAETGRWNLTRQIFTKKGKPAKKVYDEKIVTGITDVTDERTLDQMRQIENDLVFELAAGMAPSQILWQRKNDNDK